MHGWALAEQGQVEEGIAQIREGLAMVRTIGIGTGQAHSLILLAEAYSKRGQIKEGLSVLTEALAQVEKTGDRSYEAELYRLKGELTLQQHRGQATGNGQQKNSTDPRPLSPDSQGEAETCFLKAIHIARRQQAKMWELRAAVSLARLWRGQGKAQQAQKMLAEIYHWFTEGFDTKDLQEAKALLEELA
jgi:predicted ATPase